MQRLFHKKQRTPLGFCDGLNNIFVGFGSKDEKGCRPPKYHASYAPYYPIHKAASTGDVDTVKRFVERGVFAMEQIDWKYRTALHFACVYGHPEVVTLLVESSCEISPKDIKDATPLIKASQCRQIECLDILLKHGADPNIMDCSENTALHYAVYNGDIKTATKLLEYKANIEAVNENKITPLLLALKQNKEKMAEFLINNGANAKTCDFLGRSSLMYAVRCGSELIIKLLLQRDIDTFKQDVFGWTAKRYAVESKSKVRKLLIDYDEEELRQRCSDHQERCLCNGNDFYNSIELLSRYCVMYLIINNQSPVSKPILPASKVKNPPQSEAVEKTEARPSKPVSESTKEDTCMMPVLPTTDVKDPPQSEAVEKAEARPPKPESTKTDACSTPTTKVKDFPQNTAAEEAEANPSQSEPGLGVSSEKKAQTSEHNENNWLLDSQNSGDEEENSTDITKGRVLAWVDKDDSLKSLSVEEVIEVSSEEEQKGDEEEEEEEEDGGDDEDGDDEDGGDDKDGTGHQQLVEEETQQPAGKSNQENPSNKTSIFQEDKDSTEDSKEAATEQPLGKDEQPKSQKDEDSDEITEEEETEQPLGQDKASIPQTVEDSTEDSEKRSKTAALEKSNQEIQCQKTNKDKNLPQKSEDSSTDSEEEAPEQLAGKSNQGSPCKQMSNDGLTYANSGDNRNSIFECLSKKGIDHLRGTADQSGDKRAKESPKKYPLFKPTIEMNDLDGKNALGLADLQTLTSANSDSEVTSTENEKSHSDSTINSPLTIFEYLPRKEENGYLTGSSLLRGQNTAAGQMKASISETYGLKKILGYLQRISDQQTQNKVTGGMSGKVKETMSRKEQRQHESSLSDHSWTFSDPLPQRVDVSPLTRRRDQTGENMAREESKGNKVTPMENLRRHDSIESVESLSMSENPPQEYVGHLPEAADPRRENTGNGEMKGAPQLKPTTKRKSSFLNRAVAKKQERSWESAEPDKELASTEEQRSHAIRGRSESLMHNGRALCKEVTTTEQRKHKSQKKFQSLVIPQPHPLNEDIVCCTGIPGQERKNVVNMEMKVSSTEVKSTEEHETDNNFKSKESMHMSKCPPQKKDVNHLPGTANKRRKSLTRREMKEESGNKETSVEELKRHGSHQSIQSWTTSETFSVDDVHLARTMDERPESITNAEVEVPHKERILSEQQRHGNRGNVHSLTSYERTTYMEDGVRFSATTDQILENKGNAKSKAKPNNAMTSTEGQTRAYKKERQPEKADVCRLAVSIEERGETSTHGEMKDLCKEARLTKEQRRHNIHGCDQTLPRSVRHLAVTTDHKTESKTTTETKGKPNGGQTPTKKQRQQKGVEKLGTRRSNGDHLAASEHQRKGNMTNGDKEEDMAMNGQNVAESAVNIGHQGIATKKQKASKEEPQRSNENEKVTPLIISEPLTQDDAVHLSKIADQRGENVANGRMKERPNLYGTSKDQNGKNGSENSPSLLKQKRKRGLSNKMDTVEKACYDNAAAAGGGGDGDNAAAISDTGIRNGFIQQMHGGKAHNHQFPVTQKKHAGLNKKTSSEKNKAVKYMEAVDDHQLSKSLSEDYDLSDYDNVLMIVDQLQMKYKEVSLSPAKQELQQRNTDGHYEKRKKQSTEKEQQHHKREKQGLERRLRAQDMELQHLRNDVNKERMADSMDRVTGSCKQSDSSSGDQTHVFCLQEACHPETEAEHGDCVTKEHLQKVEHEVLKLVETIKKQTETIELLERKLPSEDKTLAGTDHLTQAGQEFFNAFKEMCTTSGMSQLELRIQQLEREFSEIKTRTRENVMVLENYVKLNQSHKLMEAEAKLKEVMTQFVMLTQHNTALLNLLSSVFASECPCMANVHRRLGSLFNQEHTPTPTSGLQPSNSSITAHLDVSVLSKKCFKPAKTSTVCENREHSFSEVSNTRQFEKNIPIDEPQHESREVKIREESKRVIIREDQETFDNLGNHNAHGNSEYTNLESKHSEETSHQALCKAEPEQCKDPCLERVAMSSSSSQGQLRSKDKYYGSIRKSFNKKEAHTSAPNMCMMSSDPGFGSGQLNNSLGYRRNFLQRESLKTSSRTQPFESSLSFLNKVREENQQTSYDKAAKHSAAHIKPRKSTLSNLQFTHPEEVTHQTARKTEPKCYEAPSPARIEMTNPLTYYQLPSKDRQDESLRRNFDKIKTYSSVPNMYTMTSPPGFGSGQLYNSSEHRGSLMQTEVVMLSSRPWHFVESMDSYLCR
ncbi:hypothetical protein APTSU1_000162300 [Apodemus speciosus]|uniref:DUF3496 domain-containing protein n=1 Tax=Apodemus speciosus TaxID=105296 RepID=A0ABQ0EGZ8_APOSI